MIKFSICFITSDSLILYIFPVFTQSCDDEWTSHNGHCYKIFYERLAWISTVQACTAVNGYVVTINDNNEQTFLSGMLPSGMLCWTSGSHFTTTNDWKWDTGETWNYTNWDNYLKENTGCLYIHDSQWMVDECSTIKNYVCERES